VRRGRIGREREIKEMRIESGERRRVQGVINYSGTNGEKKLFGVEGGKKFEGKELEEKKNGEYSSH
jgi:hypothetical protein